MVAAFGPCFSRYEGGMQQAQPGRGSGPTEAPRVLHRTKGRLVDEALRCPAFAGGGNAS